MTGCAIVAIPEQEDYVWNLSSEKIPHMTLLFLGELSADFDKERFNSYVEHLCKNSLRPFGLTVDRRGTLGDEDADVLFFKDNKYDMKVPVSARDYLLSDTEVLKAYNSAFQYDQWTPHLTMGYPKTPAKKDNRESPGTRWVWFDKIAIWYGDFEGPTFQLEHPDMEAEPIMMSDEAIDDHLAHYGIKGMRWGRRKSDPPVSDGVTRIKSSKPGEKLQAEGGRKVEAHPDAVKTALSKQTAKASTTDALSTKDLQELVNRMNLEQQYARLSSPQHSNTLKKGNAKVKEILDAKNTFNQIANDPLIKPLMDNVANQTVRPVIEGIVKTAFKTLRK